LATLKNSLIRFGNGNLKVINKSDILAKRFIGKKGSSILFVVDASGSMGVEELMGHTKGIVLNLLKDAYLNRERVGMITFRGTSAEVVLPFTKSINIAKKKLTDIKTGGKTPLSISIKKAIEAIEKEHIKFKENEKVLIFFTDGRANISIYGKDPFEEAVMLARILKKMDLKSFVIDTDPTWISYPYAKELAKEMGAQYYKLSQILNGDIRQIIYK
jgi:magnesium chelatase subunit D